MKVFKVYDEDLLLSLSPYIYFESSTVVTLWRLDIHIDISELFDFCITNSHPEPLLHDLLLRVNNRNVIIERLADTLQRKTTNKQGKDTLIEFLSKLIKQNKLSYSDDVTFSRLKLYMLGYYELAHTLTDEKHCIESSLIKDQINTYNSFSRMISLIADSQIKDFVTTHKHFCMQLIRDKDDFLLYLHCSELTALDCLKDNNQGEHKNAFLDNMIIEGLSA